MQKSPDSSLDNNDGCDVTDSHSPSNNKYVDNLVTLSKSDDKSASKDSTPTIQILQYESNLDFSNQLNLPQLTHVQERAQTLKNKHGQRKMSQHHKMTKMPSQHTMLSQDNKNQKLVSVEELDPCITIEEENIPATEIFFSPCRNQEEQKPQMEDRTSNYSRQSPAFMNFNGSESQQQLQQTSVKKRVSLMTELQANLVEDQEMTIQQGDQTITLDPSLVNSILRMTLQLQNDLSNKQNKDLLKAESPAKNAIPDTISSVTHKVEGFPEMNPSVVPKFRLGVEQDVIEDSSDSEDVGKKIQQNNAQPWQMSFAASNESLNHRASTQRMSEAVPISVTDIAFEDNQSQKNKVQQPNQFHNEAQEESKSPRKKQQKDKNKVVDTVVDTPNILLEEHKEQLDRNSSKNIQFNQNLKVPFATPGALKQTEKDADSIRLSENLMIIQVETVEQQREDEVSRIDINEKSIEKPSKNCVDDKKSSGEKDIDDFYADLLKEMQPVQPIGKTIPFTLPKVQSVQKVATLFKQPVNAFARKSEVPLPSKPLHLMLPSASLNPYALPKKQQPAPITKAQDISASNQPKNKQQEEATSDQEEIKNSTQSKQNTQVKRPNGATTLNVEQSKLLKTESIELLQVPIGEYQSIDEKTNYSSQRKSDCYKKEENMEALDQITNDLMHSSSLNTNQINRLELDNNPQLSKVSKIKSQTLKDQQKGQFSPRNISRIDFDIRSNALKPINEEYQNDASTWQGNVENESFNTSYRTLNHTQKQGLSGTSKFIKGDLRPHDMRLFYLDPNANNSRDLQRPQDSGNPLIDKIGLFAYSHGIDPSMFTEKDPLVAQRILEQLSHSLAPLQKQITGRFTNHSSKLAAQFNAQHSISELMNQEIGDIRNVLHDASFSSPFAQQDLSMEIDQTKNFGDMIANSKPRVSIPRRFTQMPRKNNAYSFNNPEQQLSGQVHDKISNMLKDEIYKNKAQITILSMAHGRYVNKDRQKVSQINRQLRILEQHESKVQEIIDQFKVFKKELHFAFLFASPIVVQQNGGALKFFPQLNFNKEFIKIRDSINAAQVQINITKRQCTTDSLQEVLAQMPIGLHFSGHGILNNLDMGREFYEQNKDQGDFLLLENDKGGSELVSREQLKKMIKQNKCELEFVFVATCHSEFVGKIFQEAGAKHVICIMQSKEVKDDAVITFTDTFYGMLFEQNKEICVAFNQAQLSVEIGFGQAQAQIFKILRSEDTNEDSGRHSHSYHTRKNSDQQESESVFSSRTRHKLGKKLHICSVFGPFQKGHYNYVEHQYVHLQNKAPKMPKLMGRQKDMFKVIDKIMNAKNSRLFNLIGWPGMGKSALISCVLDYISDRGLLKGGSIYFNARNISMCELFIRNFNQALISENPTLFGMARERDQIKHEPIKTLKSILEKISIIDGDILLVIDNAEELIINERNDFSMLISMMLTRVSQLKVFLTSQRLLQKTLTFKEEKIVLGNLSNIQSANLFRDVMARTADQDELNALFRIPVDYNKYPEEQPKTYQRLHDHHLITLLHGNPQSIILTASLLADPQKKLTLKHIYKMLTDEQLFKVLKEEGIEESTLVSLRISIQLSFQAIEENDPESVDLLYLLGLLPGGIRPKDLDYLWGKVTQQSRKYHIEAKRNQSAAVGDNTTESSVSSSRTKQLLQKKITAQNSWRRALAELKKVNLAEETSRRCYSTHEEHQNSTQRKNSSDFGGNNYGQDDDEQETNDDIVIILPEIVRNFAEGKVSDLNSVFFLNVLSQWYNNQLHSIYSKNENIVLSAQRAEKQRNKIARDFQRLGENLNIFIQHLKEIYQEETCIFQMRKRSKKKAAQLEDTSDSSSLTEEEELSVAEQMFSQFSQNIALPKTGTPDTIRQSLSSEPSMQNNSIKTSKTMEVAGQVEEEKNIHTNFPELRDAYFEIKQKQPALEKFLDTKKPKQMQHPREIDDPTEKALQYWRWAFEKTTTIEREKKRQNFQKANLKTIGGKTLDESFDSDQSSKQVQINQQNFGQTNNSNELQRMDTRRKLNQQLLSSTNNNRLTMRFQRGSIKDPKQPTIQQTAGFSRQISRMSVYECRKNSIMKDNGDLTMDEKVLIYYLINLILYKQFNVANSLVKKHYLEMKKCSNIFKGNFRRLQALSLYLMYTTSSNDNSDEVKRRNDAKTLKQNQSRIQKVERCLARANKQYKRVNCAWGLGLTYYQQAIMLLYQIELESVGMKHQRKGSLLVDSSRTQAFAALHISNQQKKFSQDVNYQKRDGGGQKNLEELTERTKTLFLQAAIKFKEINHWRGLYMTYRHLDQLLRSTTTEGEPRLAQDDDYERRQYMEKYKRYLDFYDVQRYNENPIIADLTIQRSGGDDLSLMTEIVIRKQNIKLFEEPDQIDEQNDDYGTEQSLRQNSQSLGKSSYGVRKGNANNIHITEITEENNEQDDDYSKFGGNNIMTEQELDDALLGDQDENFSGTNTFQFMSAQMTKSDSTTPKNAAASGFLINSSSDNKQSNSISNNSLSGAATFYAARNLTPTPQSLGNVESTIQYQQEISPTNLQQQQEESKSLSSNSNSNVATTMQRRTNVIQLPKRRTQVPAHLIIKQRNLTIKVSQDEESLHKTK